MRPARALWIAFLILWTATQLVYGAVAPWAVALAALALALLNLAALVILRGGLPLSKPVIAFLGGIVAIFALQLLPLGFLFPVTSATRAAHGIAGLWPGTADAFLTARCLAQVSVYVLSAMLVLKLRIEGLRASEILKGLGAVLALQAIYAVVQATAGLGEIPFYGPRPNADQASGTFVNRNTLAGVLAMGLVATAALAYLRLRDRRLKGEGSETGLAWALVTGLLALGLVLSKSRGGAVGALVGLLLLPFLSRGRTSLVGAIVVLFFGLAGVVLADPLVLLDRFRELASHEIREDSRWKIWTSTVAAALHQPVFGFGIGTHPWAYHPYQPPTIVGEVHHAHNEFVNFFFEGGIAWAALLLIGFMVWTVRSWQGSLRLSPEERFLSIAAIAAACAEAVHSMVDFDIRVTSAGMLFSVFIALGAALPQGAGVAPRRIWGAAIGGSSLAAVSLLALPLDSDARLAEAGKGDARHAEKIARDSLALSPYNFRAAWIFARSAQERGDQAAADRRYEIAGDLWPAHPGLQKDVGLRFWARYRETGDPAHRDRAARMFRRLLEQHPSELEELLGSIWESDRPLTEIEALLPRSPAVASAFAGFLVSKGRWKEGLEFFRQGCPESPQNAAAFDSFADRLDQEGQWGMAAAIRDRRVRVKSDPAAHAALARSWLRLDAFDRAAEQASIARRTDPSKAEWAALAGEVDLARGHLDQALEAYVEAIRLAPLEVGLRLRRASLYSRMKLYSSAADDYRQALRNRPGDRDLIFNLARALADGKDAAEGRRVLEEWLREHPKDAEAARFRDSLLR